MSEFVRLLFCHTCRTVEEVPDYQGPAEYDYYLKHRTDPHQFESGKPHRGLLGRVENEPKYIEAAIAEMENTVAPGSGDGLGQQLYDLKDNYKIEAMGCWKAHSRTTDCADYRSDAKRLWFDNKADRKAEGLSVKRDDRPSIWLCDHCPVHSLVQQRQRKSAGLYDK